jgi:hypothetical protein
LAPVYYGKAQACQKNSNERLTFMKPSGIRSTEKNIRGVQILGCGFTSLKSSKNQKTKMGYFPNGTSGMIYEEEYCSNCIHRNGPDGKSGCRVWLAHLMHNYKECNNPESALHILIPREGIGNAKCTMHISEAKLPNQMPLTPEQNQWFENQKKNRK